MQNKYIGRFAPSPTGSLHIGSIFAAVISYLEAKVHGGKWLLRIEDVDSYRSNNKIASLILKQLELFGLYWDEEVIYQSNHLDLYQEYLDYLLAQDLAYACPYSRQEWQRRRQNGTDNIDYTSGTDLRNSLYSYRLRVPDRVVTFIDGMVGRYQQNLRQEVGDFILKRRDSCFAYQIAVVVDDELQGITNIVRGQDLLSSTPRQIYLQTCLGFRQPNYQHFPLLTNEKGQKWSKQTKAPSVGLNNQSSVLKYVLSLLGFFEDVPDTDQVQELLDWAIKNWDIKQVPKKNIVTT